MTTQPDAEKLTEVADKQLSRQSAPETAEKLPLGDSQAEKLAEEYAVEHRGYDVAIGNSYLAGDLIKAFLAGHASRDAEVERLTRERDDELRNYRECLKTLAAVSGGRDAEVSELKAEIERLRGKAEELFASLEAAGKLNALERKNNYELETEIVRLRAWGGEAAKCLASFLLYMPLGAVSQQALKDVLEQWKALAKPEGQTNEEIIERIKWATANKDKLPKVPNPEGRGEGTK